MSFIYHGKPENMIGTKLIPLNKMTKEFDSLRKKYLEKYEGREEILERKIPLLDCRWNDVIQFLPFNPAKVFSLQVALGLIPEMPKYQFFEIDLSKLDPEKTAVFFKTSPGDLNTEVKFIKDVNFSSLNKIPKATAEYYKTLVGTGELPFNYQFIPHILYMGEVDISDCTIVTI